MKTRVRWIVALAVLWLALGAAGQEPGYGLREIFVPQTSEFTQYHPGSGPGQFDLSPDGKTVAVEFVTQEADKTFGVWVALWDVRTGQLVGEKQVERDIPTVISQPVRPGPSVRFPDPWYMEGVRFSPDGHMLLVLTGPRLVAVSVPDLKILYAIEDRVRQGNGTKGTYIKDPTDPQELQAALREDDRTKGEYIEGFAMATDRLAILEQTSHEAVGLISLQPSLKVLIVALDGGGVLSQWTRPGLSHSIALSPDGKLLALTASPHPWGYGHVRTGENDVFVLDADSGQVVKAFSSGYVPSDAQFLPGGTELVTTPFAAKKASQATVKVWNLKTGELERQLTYPKYGVRGDTSISANGKWVAATDLWIDPMDLKFDRDNPRGYARLLLWNLSSGKLEYDSGNLGPEYVIGGSPISMTVGEWGPQILVRMSASGDRLAVGGKIISVRSLEAVPSKMPAR
jgi:hypothetical protein